MLCFLFFDVVVCCSLRLVCCSGLFVVCLVDWLFELNWFVWVDWLFIIAVGVVWLLAFGWRFDRFDCLCWCFMFCFGCCFGVVKCCGCLMFDLLFIGCWGMLLGFWFDYGWLYGLIYLVWLIGCGVFICFIAYLFVYLLIVLEILAVWLVFMLRWVCFLFVALSWAVFGLILVCFNFRLLSSCWRCLLLVVDCML